MIPLVVHGLIAIAAGLIGVALAAWLESRLSGYRLSVVGPLMSGKTTLSTFLFTGELPKTTQKTLTATHMEQGIYRWPGARGYVRWRDIVDGSGSKDTLGQWDLAVKDADRVLYVFRIDHLLGNQEPTIGRIIRDTKHLGDFLRETGRNVPVVFVGTHADMLRRPGPEGNDAILDAVKAHPKIRSAVLELGGFTRNRFAVGSLADPQRARDLAKKVVEEVVRQ